MACHQRSTSLPSRSHSNEAKVEEELQGLKSRISWPSATIDMMYDGFRRVGDIYNCIEEIMCLPSNQVGLSLPLQKKMLEEELDRSLVLIDLCNAMQENLSELKMSTQELQLVLKRGDDVAVQLKIESFIRQAKKAQSLSRRQAAKLLLKIAGWSGYWQNQERLLSLYLNPHHVSCRSKLESPMQEKGLVSKRFQQRKVACEEQLQALQRNMGDLENYAEFLFRRLIQSRVSLLNILSS